MMLPPPACPPCPPPQTIYHSPKDTHVAVVTCGGICPGLNDVIRALVLKVGAVRACFERAVHGAGRPAAPV